MDPREQYSLFETRRQFFGRAARGVGAIALASMLRIPVSMHNVPEEDIFRPTAWGAFGTADLEAADYRACANFGPLYG